MLSKLWLLFLVLLYSQLGFSQKHFTKTELLMGSRFDIAVVGDSSQIPVAISEIKRIEKLISSWDTTSQTHEIIKNAGIKPVKVDFELYSLINRCLQISKITDGAFDISYGGIKKLWKFDGSMTVLPSKEELANSIENIGYQNIVLNEIDTTVFLRKKGAKIGFGAIGKGYAADMAKTLLIKNGVKSGIINASGDLTTWGTQANGKDWTIAITNPLNKEKVFSWLPIVNSAIATSGNYEKYVEIDGKRYSHIVDPRTGMPSSGLISVSVLAPKAELADALATSVFVMGQEVGLNFINQLPGIECIIIDYKNQIYTSDHINLEEK